MKVSKPRYLVLLALGIICVAHSPRSTAQNVSDADLVALYYPDDLISKGAQDTRTGSVVAVRRSSWATDVAGNVFAAYSNGSTGAIRVLQRSMSGVQVFDFPRNPALGGFDPSVDIQNLDGSGQACVVISFHTLAGGELTWLFKWTGSELALISPGANGAVLTTELTNTVFVDFDGDGVSEVVTKSEADDVAPYVVYKLASGAFAKWKNLMYFEYFTKGAGGVSRWDVPVNLAAGVYTAHVLNGTEGGSGRVRSGSLSLNGLPIMSPCQFGGFARETSLQVAMADLNDLIVELRGSSGGQILLYIDAS
jgi:hypothetical protein